MIKNYFHRLEFKNPSGTSRGILNTKDSWFITSEEQGHINGIGEVSVIYGLSPDDVEQIPQILTSDFMTKESDLSTFPAVSFGKEMFRLSLERPSPFHLFDSPFVNGEMGIPINGLIWMGDKQYMYDQINQKLNEGFKCLKLKIGSLDFEEEIALLKHVRDHFDSSIVEIRVDANGAFSPSNALEKLKRLAQFDIHSIEQPIAPGQWQEHAHLCASSPVDIALDEELIGLSKRDEMRKMLETIRPQYIILKPSLVGGFGASDLWINEAERLNIGWWATSALESNVGLNAIAQWVSTLGTDMYQGLGTGGLYTNNIHSPLYIKDASLWYDPDRSWNLSMISTAI